MELPDLSSLLASLGTETKTGTEYEFGGCVIEIAKDQCKITFLPKKESCHDKLSLGKLFDRFFPKGKLKTLFKDYVPIGVFQIERFVLDKCIGDLDFEAIAKEPFDIIKEKLKVKKGKLNLSFNYKEFLEAPSFDKMGIDIRGEIQLLERVMPLILNKKRDSAEGIFSLKADSLKASDFAKLFSKKSVTDEQSPEQSKMFTDAVIEEPSISGSRDVDGGFEFVVKGHVSGIKGLGKITLFVIAQKQVDEPTAVAIIADIKDIKPTTLLSTITGKDLNTIPIIKDVTANLLIEFANHDVIMLKDPDINKVLSKYIANAKTIASGTKIKVELPIKKILTAVNTQASLKHVPDLMYIQMYLHNGKVCFKFPDNITMDLLNVLVALLPKIPDILFTKILKTPPKIIIKKFDVNVATKYVDMILLAPEEIVLGSNLIKIKDAKFELKHEINGPWDFKVEATKVIGNSSLEISIATEGDKYVFTGKIDSLTTKELASHFGSKESADGILSKMDFLNFGVRDLTVHATFGDKLVFNIKGNPVLFDWEGTFFEGFIIDTENGRKMALGIVMKNIRIDEIVEKIFKKKILQTSWMSDLTASITVSNTDPSQQIDFSLPELKKHVKLKKGIFFNSQLTIPDDCKGESLCEIVREKMKPGTKLYLEGDFSSTGFELRAGYNGNGLTFGKDLILQDAKLVVSVGTSTEFYVQGEVKMKQPPVVFRGKLGISVTGRVELTLIVEGMWKKPFGLNYIAFGNLQLTAGILPEVLIPNLGGDYMILVCWDEISNYPAGTDFILRLLGEIKFHPGKVAVQFFTCFQCNSDPGGKYMFKVNNRNTGTRCEICSQLFKEFTAELHLGKIGNDKEIKAKTAIGVNPANPVDNYFYGDINKLTLGSIAEAFEFNNIGLPKVVLDTGFPNGLEVAFTTNPKGKSISHLKTQIKSGFYLKGTINILGYTIKCEILIHFPKSIKVSAEMAPIKIGNGLIKLTRKAKDLENGPKLYVGLSASEVAVKIQAYAELIGLGAEVSIDVSNKGMMFYIYGNMFNLIEANVTVSAPYAKGNLASSQFSIASCISASISDVQNEAIGTIEESAKDTEKVLSKADEEVENAGSWYSSATGKLVKWKAKLEEKAAVVQRKSRKLDNIKEFLDEDCVEKCDDVCLGGPTLKEKCKKVLGKWIPCPEWDECKTMIENPSCLAKCKGKKVYLEGKAAKKRITMEILTDAIEIIKKILQMVKTFVEKAKGLIDIAEKAAEKIEAAAKAGKDALTAITKYTKENLINIHHICFNTTLEKAEGACFGVNVDVTLFGNKRFQHDADVCFDISFIKNMGKAIADKVFPGITKIKEKMIQVREYFKDAQYKKEELKEFEEQSEIEEKDLEGKLENQKLEDGEDDDENGVDEDAEDKADIPVLGEAFKKKMDGVHKTPTHSRSERYIRHQIYGDFPSVQIQDDLTLDAFETRSPWSFSQNDSPFTTRKETKVNDDEINDQVLKGDVPLELDNLEDPDDTSKCGQTQSVVNTYSMISDTLSLLEKKLQEERQNYKKEAQRYQKEIVNTENYILRKCKKGNISEERTDDALYYINKLKGGITVWMEDVNKQINLQDEESLNMWRKSFADIIKTNKGIDIQKFLDVLDQASKETSKRHAIPHVNDVFEDSLSSASKVVHDMLTGPSGSLTAKKSSIEKLQNAISIMQQHMPCAA